MISRFATGIFTRDYKKTIGVDFLEKESELDLYLENRSKNILK